MNIYKSSYWRDYDSGMCPYCNKWVRPKRMIGFSHLCRMTNEPTSSIYHEKKKLKTNIEEDKE